MAASGPSADPGLGDVTSMSLADLRTIDSQLLEAALAQVSGTHGQGGDIHWNQDRLRNSGGRQVPGTSPGQSPCDELWPAPGDDSRRLARSISRQRIRA